jgi:hypothetical protein
MATGTSIVGTWQKIIVDWGCDGSQAAAAAFTFNANGTWTYQFGGGFWIQVEGMAAWNFNNAPGLIYTANVTRNALVGIMGYATAGSSTGCFYALRVASPAAVAAAASGAKKADKGDDIVLGPPKKK